MTTTSSTKYYCCDKRRLETVKLHGTLNGLEYLEVYDSGVTGDANRQLTLIVKFIRSDNLNTLTKDNFQIDGGERVKTVDIEWITTADTSVLPDSPGTASPPTRAELIDGLNPGELNEFMLIRTWYYGDYSLYTLHLVDTTHADLPPSGFDPRLCTIQFSFKVQCKTDFDCAEKTPCPEPPQNNPRLDYLAKDYASFRRLMLDRMSTLMPSWQDRNVASIGITLVELLAYVGDQLSYQQDAVTTEAYLATARRRTSLRRHARLVDYSVHEGCNARVWVQVDVNADAVRLDKGSQLLTRLRDVPPVIPKTGDTLRNAIAQGPLVFETAEEVILYKNHKQLSFYTWGDQGCCLPKGTTRATLKSHYPQLKAGDVLAFVEMINPGSGFAEDADKTHRWAVRLTDVFLNSDPSGGLFKDTPDSSAVDVTEIQWANQDALPFPLCLSTSIVTSESTMYIPDVSVAFGNLVLADHGMTIHEEVLGTVPEASIPLALAAGDLSCQRPATQYIPPRFRPRLAQRPLTQAVSIATTPLFSVEIVPAIATALAANDYAAILQDALGAHGIVMQEKVTTLQGGDGVWSLSDSNNAYRLLQVSNLLQVMPLAVTASQTMNLNPRSAMPCIQLADSKDNYVQKDKWLPQRDLLASDAEATEFVVECEYDGSSYLRFGDDQNGMRLDSGTTFHATYRIGNGVAGNIGLGSIAHIVSDDSGVISAMNPLPARGGTEPESAEDIRRDAPQAFRIQERAVTEADYAEVTERHPSVQRAAATFRWTGSWYTVFITVDRFGGGEVNNAYRKIIRSHLERYRMAGYDIEVNGPLYVPLEVAMTVCVKADYFRSDVRVALMRVFSRWWLPDGSPALFNPDNFTFGQPVYLSALYTAAQAVPGVESVVIDTFQRLRFPDTKPLEDGVLTIERLEIAQLDNDPNYPERGVFQLSVGGGK